MGKVSEKFIIGALGFSLFDNKKFRERKPNEIDKAFVKHFEEEVHSKLGKK